MERVKITAIIIAILYLCSVSAQDTLHVAQFAGLGSLTQVVVSGDTIDAGMPVFINRTNKRAYRADKAGSKKQTQAFALTDCLPLDTTIVVYSGRILDYPGPLTIGETYYLGSTKGTIVGDRPTSGSFQKVGIAIDSFVLEVDIDDVVAITTTPGLDDVTSVDATSYNDIIISDGVFPVLSMKGTSGVPVIEFFDINEENLIRIRPPAAINSYRDIYLPDASGTLAVVLSGSATLDFGETDEDGGTNDLTITVTGASTGDFVVLQTPTTGVLASDVRYDAFVSATNTVTVRLTNYKPTTFNPASGTFKVKVIK